MHSRIDFSELHHLELPPTSKHHVSIENLDCSSLGLYRDWSVTVVKLNSSKLF